MALPQIGKFELRQQGAYVARTQVRYMDNNGEWQMSEQTSNELAAQTYEIDPADLGVPDGATITYYLWVMAGRDVVAQESFVYAKGSVNKAIYRCSNVTVAPGLEYEGIAKTA